MWVSGRSEDATVHGERALALTREHKDQGHEAHTLRLLGEIAAQHHPPDVSHAAARSRRTATLTSVRCMPRQDSGSRPVPNYL